MNKDINAQTISEMVQAVKPYLLSVLMITVSTVLIFIAIIPQISDLLNTISARNDANIKLNILRNNLSVLKSTDMNTLDSELAVSLHAIPQTKDFESILNTMSKAAVDSAVSLGSYEFRVGDLSKQEVNNGQFPSLSVAIVVNSGAAGTSRFLTDLATSLPLSSIKSVDINGGFADITALFYYKSLPSLKIPADTPIPTLSVKQKQTLNQLTAWDNVNSLSLPMAPVASSSATNSAF